MTPEEENEQKEIEDAAIIMDFKQTFSGPHGERTLAKLTSMTTYNRGSVKPANLDKLDKPIPIDVNRLIYDEGQRAVILYIRKILKRKVQDTKQKEAK